MRRALKVLAPMSFACLAGCSGATWGNLSVLVITCGIFFGTLSLGRRVPEPASSAAPPASGAEDGNRV